MILKIRFAFVGKILMLSIVFCENGNVIACYRKIT